LLTSCLDSIKNHLHKGDFEIIVVDNASSDDTSLMIKKEFKEVMLIESKENLGYAKGMNLGVSKAKGEYLLLLNSDTKLKDDILPLFLNNYSTFEKLAVIGPRLENSLGNNDGSYGSFYTIFSVFYLLFGSHFVSNKNEASHKARYVDWVSGGCMFIKRELYDQNNGFDPRLFMYGEDVEFCYRLHKKGFNVLYDPSIVVFHVGQGSSNRSFAIIQIYKGILYFFRKHKPKWQYALIYFMLKSKAIILLSIGKMYNNEYLIHTYGQALAIS
jgi:hypothetical protein